jgi:deoxyguanosine kinase
VRHLRMGMAGIYTEDNISEPPCAPRIEVCGGIASGKTTFATLIEGAGVSAVYEDFRANPFFDLFYSDPQKYAFETELTFLLQHYSSVKVARKGGYTLICDFSLYLDLAYARVTLDERKQQAFRAVYDEALSDLSKPDLLVHLRCEAETELRRIRARGREVEQTISIEFLRALNRSLENYIKELSGELTILVVDSDRWNFAADASVRTDLVGLTLDKLKATDSIETVVY